MPTGREELAHALLLHVAAGTLDAQEVVPAVRALVGGAPGSAPTRLSLLTALRAEPAEGLGTVVDALLRRRFRDAEAAHALKAAARPLPPELAAELADLPLDVPVGWRTAAPGGTRAAEAYELLQHRLFLAGADASARLREAVDGALRTAAARLGEPPSPASWSDPRRLVAAAREEVGAADAPLAAALERRAAELEGEAAAALARAAAALATPAALAPDVPEAALVSKLPSSFRSAADDGSRRALLDVALGWPAAAMVPALLAITTESWAQEHAMLVLTLRFGRGRGGDWRTWSTWLRTQETALVRARPVPPASSTAVERLLVWEHSRGGGGETVGLLEAWARRRPAAVRPRAIVDRWGSLLSTAEANAILGTSAPGPAGALPPPLPGTVPAPASPPPAAPRAAYPPARPPAETPAWQRHVQGFFAENWYMVAGVLMVVVGSSLLAYFTWDRNWLLRYTIVPGLLGAFTATLAVTASWLEKTDPPLRGYRRHLARGGHRPAARQLHGGGAAGARPAGDAQAHRGPGHDRALPAPVRAGAGPLVAGGASAPGLPGPGPAGPRRASSCSSPSRACCWPVPPAVQLSLLPAGFYAGFLIAAWTVRRFTRDVMDREMALERRVPWFVGAVARDHVPGGVHVGARLAALPAAAGDLRAARDPRRVASCCTWSGASSRWPPRARTPAESFLGFALVRAGLLMGAGHPYVRVLCLRPGRLGVALPGRRRRPARCTTGSARPCSCWPAQPSASFRRSRGRGFRRSAWPWPWRWKWRRWPLPGAARCSARCAGSCTWPSCSITAAVAVLAQWHYRSWPPATAAVAGRDRGPASRSARRQDQSLRWLHTAMALLALALPYLGFVDMDGRRLQGNTMVFGLALLSWGWMAVVTARARDPLPSRARSTVLWLYGSPGRRGHGAARDRRARPRRGAAVDGPLLEYGGPFLMAAALAVATYMSRSIVPAAWPPSMVVVLLPALKARLRIAFPGLGWGAGYGSAWPLSSCCCRLPPARARLPARPRRGRPASSDRALPAAPHRRTRLFTGPLVACVAVPGVKTDTWNGAHATRPGRCPETGDRARS